MSKVGVFLILFMTGLAFIISSLRLHASANRILVNLFKCCLRWHTIRHSHVADWFGDAIALS